MFSRKAWRNLHFSYVHSLIFYGIIFLGITHNSIKIFNKNK
jgi:hypothetical protein